MGQLGCFKFSTQLSALLDQGQIIQHLLGGAPRFLIFICKQVLHGLTLAPKDQARAQKYGIDWALKQGGWA